MKSPPGRMLAAVAITAAGFFFVLGAFAYGLTDKNASQRDFIEYWAAGQQLVHGANPYDVPAILHLEQQAGLDDNQPKVTLSPPFILLLALPLGFVAAKTGLILWLFLLIACFLVSLWLLWRLLGRPSSGYHYLALAFAPVVACLMAGQISIFLLLGIALFLSWHRSRPLLAGAVLLPCVLKPHLFLPFAVVLLLWIVSRRAWRILAGFAVAVAASFALTLCLDRQSWSQYAHLSRSNRIMQFFVPTLSSLFHFLIDRNAIWLQFVPAALACLWAVWYFQIHGDRWNWMDHGLPVFLVSVLCAPYAFFFDEAVLLPAVLAALYRAVDGRRSLLPLALIAVAALAETCAEVPIVSRYYLWTAPAWLAWYLYATRGRATPVDALPGGPAPQQPVAEN